MRLHKRVAVVTGAGSGIGRAIAIRFAEEGANIAVPDLKEEGAAETVDVIRNLGQEAIFVKTDVSRSEEVQASLRKTLECFGQIDILVNNAGINIYRPIEDFTDEDWHRVVGVNLSGVWFYCRYIIPHFLERGRGVIINIASIGAFQTSHNRAPYMASKGGVVSLTKALALDLADRNIRVNAIAPGVVETAMGAAWRAVRANYRAATFLTPMGRFGQPVEIANAAVFLASDEASFITGHTLCVDGGMLSGNRLGRPELWETIPDPR